MTPRTDLTVGQLRTLLDGLPDETIVVVWSNNWYQYITEWRRPGDPGYHAVTFFPGPGLDMQDDRLYFDDEEES